MHMFTALVIPLSQGWMERRRRVSADKGQSGGVTFTSRTLFQLNERHENVRNYLHKILLPNEIAAEN